MPSTTTTTGIGLRRPPRQARSRARVDAIVNGLVELVHEGRGADLTTTEVAERAGIPIGSLYEYFEDLSSIVDAAVLVAARALPMTTGVTIAVDGGRHL